MGINPRRKYMAHVAALVALAALALPGTAAAAIDLTAVETAFSDIKSAGIEIFGYAVPVVAAITATYVSIRLFKRFAKSV